MKSTKLSKLFVVGPLILLSAGFAWGQNNSTPPRPIGTVTAIGNGELTLHSDSGQDLTVEVSGTTVIMLVPPGATSLKAASKISADEIVVGDRALVRGSFSSDQHSITASTIIVMSKTALAQRRQAEQQAWVHHGVSGIVKSIDIQNQQLTISVPNHPPTPQNPSHPVVISLAPNARLLRYAPDSVEFSDAKPAPFADIKVGDQVRALGTLSADGKEYSASELVSGTFRNIGATVISADASAGTIQVKDLADGKPLTVRTVAATKMHTLMPFVAMMIARFNGGGAMLGPPAGKYPQQKGGSPSHWKPGGAAPGGHPGQPFGSFDQMLNRMPPLKLDSLKPGEPLIIVSTEGKTPGEVTAVAVLAGVRLILQARPKGSRQVNLGPWNMGGTPNVEGQGMGGPQN